MLRIDYTNAPAGAGKTYGAVSYMKPRVAQGEKFILVQPITRLIGETVETTFARQGIDPTIVTEISERTRANGGITKAVIDHLFKHGMGAPRSRSSTSAPLSQDKSVAP